MKKYDHLIEKYPQRIPVAGGSDRGKMLFDLPQCGPHETVNRAGRNAKTLKPHASDSCAHEHALVRQISASSATSKLAEDASSSASLLEG